MGQIEPTSAGLLAFAMIILLKIVCFVLGYLIIRLGYSLIKSGVTGEFKFATSWKGARADLASLSPGLLFVLLGVVLIAFAMYADKSVSVHVKPVTTATIEETAMPDSVALH